MSLCNKNTNHHTFTTAYSRLSKSGMADVIPFSTIVRPASEISFSKVEKLTILHEVDATRTFPEKWFLSLSSKASSALVLNSVSPSPIEQTIDTPFLER